MKKIMPFLFFLSVFFASDVFATTTFTAINPNFYVSIPENSGSGFSVTAYLPAQCFFSATQPTLSTVGHRLLQGETWAIQSTSLQLWCKSESTVTGANFINATTIVDASINGSGSSGGGGNVNLNQVGGASYGLGQTTMSASMPVTLPSDQIAIPVTGTFWQATQPVSISGTLPITGNVASTQSGVWTVQPGNTPNTVAWKVDGSAVTQPVSGTFWQATQPVSGTVTANIGTSGSLALDASVTGLEVSQGSTTSGQKGILQLGSVTTSAPTYTTAQTSPLSLDTAGNLRVNCITGCSGGGGGGGTSATDSAAFTAGSTAFTLTGGVFNDSVTSLTSGQMGAPRVTATRDLHVNLRNNSGAEIGVSSTPLRVDPTGSTTQPVSGTVTANAGTGTFAISAASLPLPTGAATSAKQPALGTAGTPSADVLTVQGVTSMTALKVDGSAVTQPVSGTFWQATQPISGTVAATQSGTWTVQPGNTANTVAWKVDGSAVTQPVSGTFWQATQPISGTITANAGTNLNTSSLALESGGNLATIATNTGRIPSQGLAATSASSPVSLSKDVETNIVGTITTGGTSQNLRAANAADKSIEIYNNDSTEQICFIYGTTASLTAAGNYCVPALGYYSNSISNQNIDIIAATTGHKFTATIRQ